MASDQGLRNRVAHTYATIDAGMIWIFANEKLTAIEIAVSRILKKR
ncbi:HepT-like ribonuclease domain-containing protein [Bdellovibrio sp.]